MLSRFPIRPIHVVLLLGGIAIGVAVSWLVPRSDKQLPSTPVAAVPESAPPPVPQHDATPPPASQSLPPPPISSIEGRYVQYSESTSGYPIIAGRRAVDYNSSGAITPSGNAIMVDETGTILQQTPRPIGRNGLIGNPCVDPPSSHGTAYSRAY